MKVARKFTVRGQDPFSTVAWGKRSSKISNPDGSVVFEAKDIQVPQGWSQVAVDILAQKYFRRAGIPHERTHALRHTLACRLVRGGSPIKEVADVLRHRSLNTSLIYAKLDQQRLAEVALPWFGIAA